MRKTIFIDRESNETDNDICWHNLKVADKYHDLKLFISAAMAWCKINPNKNYQDLESELRKNNLNTHLIAVKRSVSFGTKLMYIDGSKQVNCEYECIFSCRPGSFALKELLTHWPSYQENFIRLRQAGNIYLETEITKITEKNFKKLTSDEMDISEMIKNNLKKIIVKIETTNEYLENLNKTCIEKFGKSYEEKLLDITPDGEFIFGMFVDDKLISNHGIMRYHNNNRVVELVELKI